MDEIQNTSDILIFLEEQGDRKLYASEKATRPWKGAEEEVAKSVGF
jgi:hypothetical protein